MTTMGLDLLNFIEERLRELPDAVLQFERENSALAVIRQGDLIAKVEVTEECATVYAADRTATKCYMTGTERSDVEDFVFGVYWTAVTTIRKYLRRKRAVTNLAYPHIAVTFEDVTTEGKATWSSFKTTYTLVMKHFLDSNPDQRFELGHTVTHRQYASAEHPANSSGYKDYLGVTLPFRDGAHMFHDAAHLGVPLYAQTAEGWIRLDVLGNSSHSHATVAGEKHRTYG